MILIALLLLISFIIGIIISGLFVFLSFCLIYGRLIDILCGEKIDWYPEQRQIVWYHREDNSYTTLPDLWLSISYFIISIGIFNWIWSCADFVEKFAQKYL